MSPANEQWYYFGALTCVMYETGSDSKERASASEIDECNEPEILAHQMLKSTGWADMSTFLEDAVETEFCKKVDRWLSGKPVKD